jgi:hypothetical protein
VGAVAKKNIVDLWIDLLQPPVHGPLLEHNGNSDRALWLVQYGPSKLTKSLRADKVGSLPVYSCAKIMPTATQISGGPFGPASRDNASCF